jgi:hypothetical protein
MAADGYLSAELACPEQRCDDDVFDVHNGLLLFAGSTFILQSQKPANITSVLRVTVTGEPWLEVVARVK